MSAALIVSHGSPSSPDEAERAIRALARAVRKLVPDLDVRGATLAASGALEGALDALAPARPVVYPMFMADGWFVATELRRRLGAWRVGAWSVARPFGLDPALGPLCLKLATGAAAREGWRRQETALLLAAHGSPSNPQPRAAAERIRAFLDAARVFRSVTLGFIDERPHLADLAGIDAPALCLPLFAARAGHVREDVPQALAEGGFRGRLLDPIGTHPAVARIIAIELSRLTGPARRREDATTREPGAHDVIPSGREALQGQDP